MQRWTQVRTSMKRFIARICVQTLQTATATHSNRKAAAVPLVIVDVLLSLLFVLTTLLLPKKSSLLPLVMLPPLSLSL